MAVRVFCYSGWKGDERPVRFVLDERDYEVREILEQWYEPESACFKVRASDGNTYVLRRTEAASEERWSLQAAR